MSEGENKTRVKRDFFLLDGEVRLKSWVLQYMYREFTALRKRGGAQQTYNHLPKPNL